MFFVPLTYGSLSPLTESDFGVERANLMAMVFPSHVAVDSSRYLCQVILTQYHRSTYKDGFEMFSVSSHVLN